jgi:hypothetical protein
MNKKSYSVVSMRIEYDMLFLLPSSPLSGLSTHLSRRKKISHRSLVGAEAKNIGRLSVVSGVVETFGSCSLGVSYPSTAFGRFIIIIVFRFWGWPWGARCGAMFKLASNDLIR